MKKILVLLDEYSLFYKYSEVQLRPSTSPPQNYVTRELKIMPVASWTSPMLRRQRFYILRERNVCVWKSVYLRSHIWNLHTHKKDLFEETLKEVCKIHISSRIFRWLWICFLYIRFPIIPVNGRQTTWVIENPQS